MSRKRITEKPRFTDGFTIIEVVLVLAIAGLIFLMVFIALPALQRSQRDTQRRDDIARAQTALTQYMANNRNKTPEFDGGTSGNVANVADNWGSCDMLAAAPPTTGFCKNYLMAGGDMFEDPDGTPYLFAATDGALATMWDAGTVVGDFPDQDHQIWVTYNAKCNGEATEAATGIRKVAFQYKLEGGGVVCVNN
jgi:prepilin-type N-terminal cleavage/methylation domain-containing protein